jgi:putative FmdB family regulatory protein
MPFYDYQCEDCRNCFEEHKSVDKRYPTKCNRCGSLRTTIRISRVAIHSFEPYYDIQLGATIKSPTHKKQVAKSLGLTNVGDAKLHEIEQQASQNKREQELKGQTPTPEFMEAWHKAKATIPN